MWIPILEEKNKKKNKRVLTFLSTQFHRCEIITDLGWMLLSNHCHLPEELVKFAIPVRNLCIQSNVWQARWRKTKNKTLKSCLIQGFYWKVRNFLMTQFKLKTKTKCWLVVKCGHCQYRGYLPLPPEGGITNANFSKMWNCGKLTQNTFLLLFFLMQRCFVFIQAPLFLKT